LDHLNQRKEEHGCGRSERKGKRGEKKGENKILKWLLPFLLGFAGGVIWFIQKGKVDIYVSEHPEYKTTFYIKDLFNSPQEPQSLWEHLLDMISVKIRM